MTARTLGWPRLVWLAVPFLAVSCPHTLGAPRLPVLTTLQELQDARPATVNGRQPVELQALVTYFDGESGVVYLRDATGALSLEVGKLEARVLAGDRVVLSAALDSKWNGFSLPHPRLRVVGQVKQERMPAPRALSAAALMAHEAEAEWVEVRGLVREERNQGSHQWLTLEADGLQFTADIFNIEEIRYPSLVGARVRIRGVAPAAAHLRLRAASGDFLSPHTNYVRIDEDAPSLPTPAAEALTTVAMVRGLSPAEAARGRLVRLHATVTYNYPEMRLLFVEDRTGGLYVEAWRHFHSLRAGDEVEIRGISAPGAFAPIVLEPRVRVIGHGPLPAARHVSAEQLTSGQEDSQWVEVDGVVRAVAAREPGVVIDVAVGRFRVAVEVPDVDGAGLGARLVNAQVRVRGACRSRLTLKGQFSDVTLDSPSLDAFTVVAPPPADPYALPVRPILSLLEFAPDQDWQRRVRVQGTVVYSRPGRVYVRDATGGLELRTGDAPLPATGDVIDAVGFAAPGDYSPELQDAIVRTVRAGAPTLARPVSPEEALSGQFDGELVQIDARLLDSVASLDQERLLAQAGPYVFAASLPVAAPLDLRPGSELRLTGICAVEASPEHVPQSFQILLRGREDVVVRHAASWWTSRNSAWVLAAMVGLVALSFAWVATLRRRVRAQSHVIWRRVQHETALQERQRMARELHDTLEQNLAGISLSLEAARLTVHDKPSVTETHLERALDRVDASIAEVHNAVWALRDPGLGERDLAASLDDMGRQLAGCSATPAAVVTRAFGSPRSFPVNVENNLLRIGQEALTNAVKHGKATHIDLHLRYDEDAFRLEVRDDGRGFDAAAPVPAGHFGLLGMRERAAEIGARLEVASVANRGTEVRLTLPLAPPALRRAG